MAALHCQTYLQMSVSLVPLIPFFDYQGASGPTKQRTVLCSVKRHMQLSTVFVCFLKNGALVTNPHKLYLKVESIAALR